MTTPTGTCRFDPETGRLVITTQRRKKDKLVPLTVTYHVVDARPDTRVADPAYTVTKIAENDKPCKKWVVYHVWVDPAWGVDAPLSALRTLSLFRRPTNGFDT